MTAPELSVIVPATIPPEICARSGGQIPSMIHADSPMKADNDFLVFTGRRSPVMECSANSKKRFINNGWNSIAGMLVLSSSFLKK
jgi:hypothetical protein